MNDISYYPLQHARFYSVRTSQSTAPNFPPKNPDSKTARGQPCNHWPTLAKIVTPHNSSPYWLTTRASSQKWVGSTSFSGRWDKGMGTRDGRFYSGLIKWAGVQTVNRVYLYGLVGVGVCWPKQPNYVQQMEHDVERWSLVGGHFIQPNRINYEPGKGTEKKVTNKKSLLTIEYQRSTKLYLTPCLELLIPPISASREILFLAPSSPSRSPSSLLKLSPLPASDQQPVHLRATHASYLHHMSSRRLSRLYSCSCSAR